MAYVQRSGLDVDAALARFLETEALPGTGIGGDAFWAGFAALARDFTPENRALLTTREEMQQQIDAWHAGGDGGGDPAAYREFLGKIGYLVEEGPDFEIETSGIDPEIAAQPGPQLVVPVTNARYALNAANARWGSLYDALYGSDALGDVPAGGDYDPRRGTRVVARAKTFLDEVAPLAGSSHAEVEGYRIGPNGLEARMPPGQATVAGQEGEATPLADPGQFVGYRSDSTDALTDIYLINHGLHIRIRINPTTQVGRTDPAGVSDVELESAISSIIDLEDSVATVDGEDKAAAYRNWLGLMRGDLTERVEKDGESFTRSLADDRVFTAPDGGERRLKGRALMLVRNVGHLMTTPAVLDGDGEEVFEGLLDAMIGTLIAIHDLKKEAGPRNATEGSVYVVKPKMHGPAEVAFADTVFARVEDVLGLPRHTVKLGIMDEERRLSANLKECIRAAKHRVAFINTGFLDRTGDEIHTSMEAGPMVRKGAMKDTAWIKAYEDRNVDIGLACGLAGRAQIGKGMWAAPERMAAMLEAKIGHPEAGASTAWVPSPTAATVHAMHYHYVDVPTRQAALRAGGPHGTLADLLTIPVMAGENLSEGEVTREIENNAQGILGYVVRWIDRGIGCSKVPDIDDIALMEDRATCRISSQALANWLHQGVVTEPQVMDAMRRMAAVVDRQNEGDPAYTPMSPGYDGVAFQAACDLVFKGRVQPSGYTEPVLHARRREKKGERHG